MRDFKYNIDWIPLFSLLGDGSGWVFKNSLKSKEIS